ncbi:hypothetical protein HOD75_03040 [archaeon]|jgi:replicative DNA helicase Mcm|nr:hypothetical protein [archaeon]MBT4241849.1 hypothetical protein [archaeon]MBT4418396.1 hypothetical protein [archaeon]
MADKKPQNEELIIEAKSFFETYKKEIGESIRKAKKVIYVNFQDLSSSSPTLAEALISNPEEILQLLETALEETGLIKLPRIRFNDLPNTQKVKIRTIRANHLNQLIFFEGLVRQASEVRPQVVNAKFECPSCGTVISVLQIEKKFREPTRCSCGRKGQFNLLSKAMVDAQRLVIEESPESLTGGEQPRRMNVFLKEDLVEPGMEEKTTPGSKVKILGILKEVPVPLPSGAISTRFDLAIEANNIIPLESTYEDLDISEEDERQINELAEDPELFKKLRESIAPSIWGYNEIKESLVLQMFGGVRKISPDGTVSRGDIHLFLMGDPGVAKSIGKDEKIKYISKDECGCNTIEDLFDKFGRDPKNLKVLTIDMKTHKPKWAQVNEIIKHLPEKKLLKIKTEHGKSIIGTEDHSFIKLSDKGEIVSIKGNKLNKGNHLPIPINYHKKEFDYFYPGFFNKKITNSKLLPKKIKLDKDFGFFVGIYLAEGYIKAEKTINISNKNKEIQSRVIEFSKKLNLNYNFNDKEVSIFSKNLADILKTYCYDKKDLKNLKNGVKGNYSRIKKIPEFLFFAPKEFIYGLLSGLFSGDGRLIKDKKMLKGFELITISKNLAEDTSDLLFSIGILNKLKERSYDYKSKLTPYYSISVPTPMINKFTENIEFIGREFNLNASDPIYSYKDLIPCGELLYELTKKLGYNSRINGDRSFAAQMRTIKKRGVIGRLRLKRILKMFEEKSTQKYNEFKILKKIANSPIIWSKINEIKELPDKNEEVYDLSIPSTNTFVANGIGVHNSVTLKFVSNIAPKGRYIVGMAASGPGITATVVKDEFLKGWSLEAGAMVLANKGVICIDEIEKMGAEDRSAMHEALEQQTVTISKANVQACYSSNTEVLTEKGWKKYNEVQDIKIAQYNPKNKQIEFLSHKGLFIYDYKGKMFSFKNKRNDILVTPNHKMLLKKEGNKEYEAIKAEDIKYKRIKVLNSGEFKNKETNHFILPPIKHKQNRKHPKYTHQHTPKKIPVNLWLEFLGYYLTEGGVETNPTIGITQKDKKNINKIKKCLKKLSRYVGFKLSEIKNKNYTKLKITNTQLYSYLEKCGRKSYEKRFPEEFSLSSFSKKQLKIIYNAMMLGDGSSDGKYYGSTSKKLIDMFQGIACLIGKSANLNLHYKGAKRGNRKDMYRTSLSNKTELSLRKEIGNIQEKEYNGKVFCFSTKTGFFLTRRNGKIAIQGNTLSAETSVLAAGNPKFGRFEPTQSIVQQIDLPPALISRFDLIFIQRDLPDAVKDEAIADHVLKMHQKKDKKPDIERDLFKRYIAYSKQKIEPALTDEAFEEIKSFYVKMRKSSTQGEDTGSISITARQLQGLVRLAEAHAKSRLSPVVEAKDAQVAIRLTNYYLLQVGYDPETKTFDIDRISSKISSGQRNKIVLVKETIKKLEEQFGKMVPADRLRIDIGENLSDTEFDEAIEQLKKSGDIFHPKSGFIQGI